MEIIQDNVLLMSIVFIFCTLQIYISVNISTIKDCFYEIFKRDMREHSTIMLIYHTLKKHIKDDKKIKNPKRFITVNKNKFKRRKTWK